MNIMKKKRNVTLFSALAVLVSVGALASCSNGGSSELKTEDMIKLEAEKAVVKGTPSSGSAFLVESDEDSKVQATGWEYIGNLAVIDNSITWVFEGTKEGKQDFILTVSNTQMASVKLEDQINIKVNDVDATFSLSLDSGDGKGENWQKVTVTASNIKSGYNFIVLSVKANTLSDNGSICAPNVDNIYIPKDGNTIHTHVFTDTSSGDCLTAGYTHSECDDCGISYDHDYTNPVGHQVGEDGICSVCGKKVYSYEAENTDISGVVSSYGSVIGINSAASNGYSVGSFSKVGNTLAFKIDSTISDEVTFVFRLSSTRWADGSTGGNVNIASTQVTDVLTISLNETEITPSSILPGSNGEYYFNWANAITKATVNEGENSLKIVSKTDAGAPNIDVVQMTADNAVLSWTDIDNVGDSSASQNEHNKVTATMPDYVHANQFVYESEDAVITGGSVKDNETDTSNNKFVGDLFNGNSITYNFTSSEAGVGNLIFKMASTGAIWNNGVAQNMVDFNLAENTAMTFNGTAVDLSSLLLKGYPSENFFNWNYLSLTDAALVKGENIVVFEIPCSWGGPNMDNLIVDSDLTIEKTVITPQA